MELCGAHKAPHSPAINHRKGFRLFPRLECCRQQASRVRENFRLTMHLLDLRHVE
jgi:hypothetical protein